MEASVYRQWLSCGHIVISSCDDVIANHKRHPGTINRSKEVLRCNRNEVEDPFFSAEYRLA